MLSYKDAQGTIFSGRTARDVVRSMKKLSWTIVSKGQYMREVAARLQALGSSGIATNNSVDFLASLVKHGWLTPTRRK